MIIIRPAPITFAIINAGECIQHKWPNSNVYMKMRSGESKYNAVNLYNGMQEYIPEHTMIYPIKTELKISW